MVIVLHFSTASGKAGVLYRPMVDRIGMVLSRQLPMRHHDESQKFHETVLSSFIGRRVS